MMPNSRMFLLTLVLAMILTSAAAKPAATWTFITASTVPTTTTTTTAAPPSSGVCHPTPTNGVNQFMIGYGSLMQNASKSRTAPNTGDSIPVQISGFSRQWNAQGVSLSYSTTFLGIVANATGSFNGVIFQLPNSADMNATLTSYDVRESWYCRKMVPSKDVVSLVPGFTVEASAEYWIYVNKPEFTAAPNAKYPIVESYVDIFISGCLELETKYQIPKFAQSCVTSTIGWESPWVNDRIYPRRAFIYEPMASKIDAALSAGVPAAYNAITIEGKHNLSRMSKAGELFTQKPIFLVLTSLCFTILKNLLI